MQKVKFHSDQNEKILSLSRRRTASVTCRPSDMHVGAWASTSVYTGEG